MSGKPLTKSLMTSGAVCYQCLCWHRVHHNPNPKPNHTADVLAQVEGYQYASAGNRMRLRMFNVLDDVKRDHAYAPIVTCPSGKAPSRAPSGALLSSVDVLFAVPNRLAIHSCLTLIIYGCLSYIEP